MSKKLTPKQTRFAEKYIETGNASEAYRESYDVKTTNQSTIARKANELVNHPAIAELIKELQSNHRERHDVTVDSLTAELDEARALARELADPKAMISASLGKAKIHGLDKQVVEHQGDLSNLQPVVNLAFGGK